MILLPQTFTEISEKLYCNICCLKGSEGIGILSRRRQYCMCVVVSFRAGESFGGSRERKPPHPSSAETGPEKTRLKMANSRMHVEPNAIIATQRVPAVSHWRD